ncbi:hypothetical protein JX266_005961 [Neoarthrinium moseri]|nr:hypothetical protein JX266_005961 [Neoarthrinium moseri]
MDRLKATLDPILTPVQENIFNVLNENILPQVQDRIVNPVQANIINPIHDNVLQPLERNVISPIENFLSPLEHLANRIADFSLLPGAPKPRIGFEVPPFDPDQDFNCAQARKLFDKLRDQLGSNMPFDKQNGAQDPLGQAAAGTEAERAARRERKFADFESVLTHIDFDAVTTVAEDVAVMAGLASKYRGPARLGAAIFGTHVVCYPIIWDGDDAAGPQVQGGEDDPDRARGKQRWIVKFPVNGAAGQWTERDARALRSEVGTMAWLRRELGVSTRLNVPRVYHWDASTGTTTGNRVGVPFVMMQFVDGVSAFDAWFTAWEKGGNWWRPEADEVRKGILAHVALAMSELGRFEFDEAGALEFDGLEAAPSRDPRGRETVAEVTGIGPLRVLDIEAMLNRWLCKLSPDAKDACERTPIYTEVGPWKGEDAEERYYTSRMDCHYVGEDTAFGGTLVLRSYLRWFHESARVLGLGFEGDRVEKGVVGEGAQRRWATVPRAPFVLAHPDLSLHNVIVDARGRLWFVGWSGVAAVPRAVGHEALPLWLVRDWNPFVHRWRDTDWPWRYRDRPWAVNHNGAGPGAPAAPVPEHNRTEEPRWKLRAWRDYYADCMRQARAAWGAAEAEQEAREWDAWLLEQARMAEAAEQDSLEAARADLFAPRGKGGAAKVKGKEKAVVMEEKEEGRRVDEEQWDEPRGRPRYRHGEEPPPASASHKPERHVSFAAGTKPESSQPPRSDSSGDGKPQMNRTLLSLLPLTLVAAANDPRCRPMALQEIFHQAVPEVARWENFELARARERAGEGRETVPRPYEVEDRRLFYRMLLDCAGVPRGPGRPVEARLGGYGD